MNRYRHNLNVVIADDDPTTRYVLRLLLNEQHCNVVGEAADGQKALELCIALRPDIAFIDIQMPKLDGIQSAQMIRQNNRDIGIIMISVLSTLQNVRQAMQVGANGFVVKPFSAIKLVDSINNCLKTTGNIKSGMVNSEQ